MPAFIIGARGHDFGRHTPADLLAAIGQAGFTCTQLAYTKAIEGVKSYADVTPALVEDTRKAVEQTGVRIAVYGTYVELSYTDEDKRRAEAAKVIGQVGNAKRLGAGCMGSETTAMAKQPGVTRKEALEALLRSLGEIIGIADGGQPAAQAFPVDVQILAQGVQGGVIITQLQVDNAQQHDGVAGQRHTKHTSFVSGTRNKKPATGNVTGNIHHRLRQRG